MRQIVLTFCVFAALAGCTRGKNFHEFDGHFFRASAKGERGDRQSFAVTVRGISKSEDGAREAGRYEGTKYCLRRYGTSLITWTQGPDDEALSPSGDTFQFAGRCVQ